MDPSQLAQLTSGKIISCLLGLLVLMGFGLMMAFMTGPPAAELHEAQMRQAQLEAAMEQQRMFEAGRHDAYSKFDAADIGATMSYGH